jgi:cytochrome oxidase Cu insertion factor (SCO1/SenC/PrrC family)
MINIRLSGLILIAAILLSSCAPATSIDPQISENNTLPTEPKAPAITNQVWLNTDKPLTPADLNGKVILIDFWTFS